MGRRRLGCVRVQGPVGDGAAPRHVAAWEGDGDSAVETSIVRTMAQVLSGSHIEVSSYDTVNTQEGNIYDFGGYFNYNLGNSYEEAWINQKAEFNKKNKLVWPDSTNRKYRKESNEV